MHAIVDAVVDEERLPGSPMRVLHLTRDFPPSRHHGGISTAVGSLARASARAGLAVSVVSFDDWRPRTAHVAPAPAALRDEDGVAVLRVSAPPQLDAARAFATAQRPQVLHVHHGMLWPFAAALRGALGAPTVKTVHVVQRQMNALRRTAERTASLAGQDAALAGADRIVAPSHAAAAALLAHDPTLAPRLRVVPHGIDDVDWKIPPDPPFSKGGEVISPFEKGGPGGISPSVRFLSAGRFDGVKGTPELFEVIAATLTRLPDASFVVAGGVPANRRAEARWMAAWRHATSVAIGPRVRFTGWLSPDELSEQYGAATAVILTSRFESFGLVALEAMLRGLPVASTAAGGVAELIAHAETGLLSPVGDVAALADHAVALAGDAGLRRRLGTAAAAAVRDTYLWPRVLPTLLDVYQSLIADR